MEPCTVPARLWPQSASIFCTHSFLLTQLIIACGLTSGFVESFRSIFVPPCNYVKHLLLVSTAVMCRSQRRKFMLWTGSCRSGDSWTFVIQRLQKQLQKELLSSWIPLLNLYFYFFEPWSSSFPPEGRAGLLDGYDLNIAQLQRYLWRMAGRRRVITRLSSDKCSHKIIKVINVWRMHAEAPRRLFL